MYDPTDRYGKPIGEVEGNTTVANNPWTGQAEIQATEKDYDGFRYYGGGKHNYEDVAQLSLHEFGHMVGLTHQSEDEFWGIPSIKREVARDGDGNLMYNPPDYGDVHLLKSQLMSLFTGGMMINGEKQNPIPVITYKRVVVVTEPYEFVNPGADKTRAVNPPWKPGKD